MKMKITSIKIFSVIAILYALISFYFKFDIITRYIEKQDSPIQQLFFPIILFVGGVYLLFRNSKTKEK